MSTQQLWDEMLTDSFGDLKPMARQHLPHYSEWGSYPIVYVTTQNNVLCADCATRALYELDSAFDPPCLSDVYYEGAPIECDDCYRPIESAYGNPWAEESE